MEHHISQFFQALKHICPELSEQELDFVRPHLKVQHLPKKKFYLIENQIPNEFSFICSGLIRCYFIDLQVKENTVRFFKENLFVTDYLAFLKQAPTHYFFECIEESILVSLPYEIIQESYIHFKNWEKCGRIVAEKALESRVTRIENFLFKTAEERFTEFMEENPNLYKRISMTHLASYLGLERQSLSRVKKKVLEEQFAKFKFNL